MKKILLPRRYLSEVTHDEKQALEAKWPGEELQFITTDPKDFREHADDCVKFNPDCVLLPVERPLPYLAMRAGYKHICISPNSQYLLELKRIHYTLDPF